MSKRERIYRISEGVYLTLYKDWSMKFGGNLYYVYEGIGPVGHNCLGKFSSFSEARQLVKDAAEEAKRGARS